MPEHVTELRSAILPIDDCDELLHESIADGHNMLRRLIDDWQAGSNRFSRLGELLLSAHRSGQCHRSRKRPA
jgi:hypothetical protein